MKTNPPSNTLDRERLERDTLRLLCSILVKPGTRLEICRLLHPEDFQDPIRRAVFEEIKAAGELRSRGLRASLKARMQSRGFPALDLDKLLSPRPANETDIARLFESTLCLLRLEGANALAQFASEANVED